MTISAAKRERRWDEAVALLDGVSAAVDTGRYDDALTTARRAARMLARVVGVDHPDYAGARLALGRVLRARGQLRASLSHLEYAVVTLAKVRGGDVAVSELAVDARLALAQCLQEMGRFDDARKHARAALRLASRRLRPTAALTVMAHNLLGVIGKFSGRFAEAERHYRAALSAARRRFGPRSPQVATILHNLGGLEHARGNFKRGEQPARRSVEIARALMRPDDPERVAHEVAYAALLDGLGRHDESVVIYRRALGVFVKRYGREHYEVASTLHNLAAAELARGNVSAAENHYREASTLLVKLRGTDHPDLALTHYNLALLYADTGRRASARVLLRRARATFQRRLGPSHPQTRACVAALARLDTRR